MSGEGSLISLRGANDEEADIYTGFQIGNGGTGTAVVSDGAELRYESLSGFGFNVVGDEAPGTVLLESGGRLVMDNTAPDAGSGNFVLGDEEGISGTVTVTGQDTQLVLLGQEYAAIEVGDLGQGTLTVLDGGKVVANRVFVGREVGSSGEVVVEGAGSTLEIGVNNSGILPIGVDFGQEDFEDTGVGNVTVKAGASVRVGNPGDGQADIIVGADDSLTVEDGASIVGDIRVIGSGDLNLANGVHEGDLL
jgi:T5SS/PEP-CTERM-associated repeat protein